MDERNTNLDLPLTEARLPGRIISMQSIIGDTLENLCSMTAYDLGRLKGVGDNVVDSTREILSFYGLSLSGDTRTDYYTGEEHPEVASYRARLNEKHPGLVELLGTLSDREVGEQFDVSAQAINNHRRKLSIGKAKRAKKASRTMVWMERAEILAKAINDTLALLGEGESPVHTTLTAALAEVQADRWVEDESADEAPVEEAVEEVEAAPVETDWNAPAPVIPVIEPPAENQVEDNGAGDSEVNEVFDFGQDDFSDDESDSQQSDMLFG